MSFIGIIGLVFFVGILFVFIQQIRAHSNIYSLVSLASALVLSMGLVGLGFQAPIGGSSGAGLWIAFVVVALLIIAPLSMLIFGVMGAIKGKTSPEVGGGLAGRFIPIGIALLLLIVAGWVIFAILAAGAAMQG